MIPPKREAIKTEKLNKILRIYYNAPVASDGEEFVRWICEVAKIWNNKRNSNLKCEKLDILSGKLVEIVDD